METQVALFMNEDQLQELDELVHDFPVGDVVMLGKNKMWIMGYYSCDQLLLADCDPRDDYDAAMKSCWSYQAHIFRRKH